MTTRAVRRKPASKGVEPVYPLVGELVRTVRKGRGETVQGAADALGVSRQQLTKWEGGRTRIPLHKLYDLAAHWGVPVDAFSIDLGAQAITFQLSASAADVAALRRLGEQGE